MCGQVQNDKEGVPTKSNTFPLHIYTKPNIQGCIHISLTVNSLINRAMPGFRPGSRATFLSGKVAKTIDAPSGLRRERTPVLRGRSNSHGSNKSRPLSRAFLSWASRQASVSNESPAKCVSRSGIKNCHPE